MPLYAHNQGLALRMASAYLEAQEAFQRAIEIDARYYDSHEALGDLYFHVQDYAAARQAYERATEIAEAPPVLTQLARVYLATNRDYSAVAALINDALTIDPGYAPAYYARGLMAEQNADWPAAEKDFRAARRLDPQLYEAYFKQAIAYAQLARPTEAIASLEAFIQRAPPDKYMQQIVAARVHITRLRSATSE